MKRFTVSFFLTLVCLCSAAGSAFAAVTALADGQYTIVVSKFNTDGTLTQVSTAAATATGGKLDFTLSAVPTKDEANFLYFELKDSGGVVMRQGFAPAPPASDTNRLGINELADQQAQVLKASMAGAGSDDPIMVAYMLIILRAPGATTNDVPILANMGKTAIRGATAGFEWFLTDSGVTSTALANLKNCLVYNADSTKKTLRSFSENYYNAVNKATASDETAEMQKAGGFMAEVFLDASVCASVNAELILAAHNAAGDAIGAGRPPTPGGIFDQFLTSNPTLSAGMESAMSSFHTRIAAAKVAKEYGGALTTLGASGTQVTNFLTAGATMMQTFESIEATYSGFFMDQATYLAANPGKTAQQVQDEIGALFDGAFKTFRANIASSNTEINAMKAKILQLPGITAGTIPNDFGTFISFDINTAGDCTTANGTWSNSQCSLNWPIPQTVMVTWLADALLNGGSFTYTRATSPAVPAFAVWMGSCSDPQYWNQFDCVTNLGPSAWTIGRRDYSNMSPSAAFNAYMGIQEDLNILELNRFAIYQGGGTPPTRAQETAAKQAFQSGTTALAANISGNKTATTSISTGEKEAIIMLLKQPSMD